MREIAPFGVRMPAELKAKLTAEATRNGRSINTEVIARLAASFSEPDTRLLMQSLPPAYLDNGLTPTEREMLAIFKTLPAEKRLALLTLISQRG